MPNTKTQKKKKPIPAEVQAPKVALRSPQAAHGKLVATQTSTTSRLPLEHADTQDQKIPSNLSSTDPFPEFIPAATSTASTEPATTLLNEFDNYVHTCVHCWLHRNNVNFAPLSIGCFYEEIQRSILTHYHTPTQHLPYINPLGSYLDQNPAFQGYIFSLYEGAFKRLITEKTWTAPRIPLAWWPTSIHLQLIFNLYSAYYINYHEKMASENANVVKKEREVGAYESCEGSLSNPAILLNLQY